MNTFEIVSVTTLDPMSVVVTTLNPLAKAETSTFFVSYDSQVATNMAIAYAIALG